jgi:hypothetical protein
MASALAVVLAAIAPEALAGSLRRFAPLQNINAVEAPASPASPTAAVMALGAGGIDGDAPMHLAEDDPVDPEEAKQSRVLAEQFAASTSMFPDMKWMDIHIKGETLQAEEDMFANKPKMLALTNVIEPID